MEIKGISLGTGLEGGSALGGGKELGKEAFLNLLVTQMKHQDPLAPQDSQELVAQLVQFSNLEQLTGLNRQMEELKSIQTDTKEVLLLNYLGKNILFQGNTFRVSQEGPVPLHYRLAQEAKEVQINIRRSDGELVNALSLGPQEMGDHQILFASTDKQGKPLPGGKYFFDLKVVGWQGETVSAHPLSEGRVTEVATSGDMPYVVVGETKVPLEEVIRIQE